MKTPTGPGAANPGKLVHLGRRSPANAVALQVLKEATAWVEAHPEASSLIVMVGSPGQCRPFSTPIDRPLDFIGILELMKHDLFREK
ncbi:MAG: hypothetical protein LC123_02535 [Burkholderiales bacterium]|nr:hypothetical protein [Rhodocyclaceae bacterium]MCZ2418708.1 hypothetical protein [Burkholderiales bacterium]HNQ58398.1 hypothetical protein [Candidatus Desulfobacillus denitrificans]